MKIILSLTFLFAAITLFANAGIFRGSGQTVVLDSTAQIQMVEEVVTMTPMQGKYPVDASCRNLDPMKFHCVFKLRNLTDETVTVPVGFPISTEALWFQDNSKINQTEVIASFGFVAGTKGQTYPVRYVPFDRKKKFSNIFLWDMTFQPKQEIELFVCYTMYGYLGLASTQKGKPEWGVYKHNYLHGLEYAAGEGNMYVTETGKSWAGKIEKATFRIHPFEFEKYLLKRGAYEGIRKDKNKRVRFLQNAPLVRKWSPDYRQWKSVKIKSENKFLSFSGIGGSGDLYLEMVYAPFEPKGKQDDLSFFYVFPSIPTTAELFDCLLETVKRNMDKEYAQRDKMLKIWAEAKQKKSRPEEQIKRATDYWQNLEPYSPSVERNLADAVLEFYGIPRNNPEIKEFLERQCWYPADPRPIDPALKKRLLEAGKGTK